MLFLTPNHQCQSSEGSHNESHYRDFWKPKLTTESTDVWIITDGSDSTRMTSWCWNWEAEWTTTNNQPAWIFVLHLQNQRNQAAIKCNNGAEAVTAPHLTRGGSSSRSMHSAVRILTMSPTWFLRRRRRRRVGTGCSAVHGRRSSSAGLGSTAARRPVSRRRRHLEPALQWQTAAGPGSFQLQVKLEICTRTVINLLGLFFVVYMLSFIFVFYHLFYNCITHRTLMTLGLSGIVYVLYSYSILYWVAFVNLY